MLKSDEKKKAENVLAIYNLPAAESARELQKRQDI
jgi:hypothetical protein